jgi:hypothetical protein
MTNFAFYNKQVILRNYGEIVSSSEEILDSSLFKEVIKKYLEFLNKKESPLLDIFPENGDNSKYEEKTIYLLQKLAKYPCDKIIESDPEIKGFFDNRYLMLQFVENLYNFWRNYERYFIVYSDTELKLPQHKKPYRTFNSTIEEINHFVRKVYRDICENISNDHPNIYRQVAAGFPVGLIAAKNKSDILEKFPKLKEVPLITQIMMDPPLIIDPPMNKRSGLFEKVESNPFEKVKINKDEWLCYPAKVGHLIIHVYFHNKFINLGASLANLFDIVEGSELNKKPDAIYLYGVDKEEIDGIGKSNIIFYEDKENDIMLATVPRDDVYGYFGYLKKMMLTLHNIICIKKGMMPIHGAMVRVMLKNGKKANIMIVGDSGAGKSESLEAFRTLSSDFLRDMTIIFDDMGSLKIEDGKVKAYGTETGAFVRLDDLQPGFAFGNLDRSIIMSPQKINARAVMPITTLKEVQEGHDIDFFLYANNYEVIKDNLPYLKKYDNIDEAYKVFEKGARMAKGTTSEKGITESYFANPFGAPQYKHLHDPLARKYFEALFENNIFVGQLRTQLGVDGFETKGPEDAAKALFEEINKLGE